MIIWDAGTYRSLTDGPVEEAIDAGHLSFWLDGEKLRGGWTLQRTGGGAKPQWLLVKRRDEAADAGDPVATRPESVVSGRTIRPMRMSDPFSVLSAADRELLSPGPGRTR